MTHLQERFRAARRTSTPIVAVRTPDQSQVIVKLSQAACRDDEQEKVTPRLAWDIVRGLVALNAAGVEALAAAGFDEPALATNLVMVLDQALRLPAESILFVRNAHRYLDDSRGGVEAVGAVVQALSNLRDAFKVNFRMCVLLGPDFRLPPELLHDTFVLDEPYPTAEELGNIVTTVVDQAGFPAPEPAVLEKAVDALRGLPVFPAETYSAMCVKPDGSLDTEQLWEKKRQVISSMPGVTLARAASFQAIGGLENAKRMIRGVFSGPDRPRVVVLLDEMEKQFGGLAGDTSGTTQSQLGQVCTYMAENKSDGILLLGIPGSGKSEIAKAAGSFGGVPTLFWSLPETKGGIVGQTESQTASVLKTITAIGDGRALFMATVNRTANLPAELQRRFKLAVFFVDLPGEEDKALIWNIKLAQYGVSGQVRPDDTDWTGAEIEACVYKAWKFGWSLEESSLTINPVARAMGEQLVRLRQEAERSNYISASYKGFYRVGGQSQVAAQTTKRAIRKA